MKQHLEQLLSQIVEEQIPAMSYQFHNILKDHMQGNRIEGYLNEINIKLGELSFEDFMMIYLTVLGVPEDDILSMTLKEQIAYKYLFIGAEE